ncbi:DgyrCDS9566 [Dimorphilus gyrociliatus]|uniref:DgyrCDS9566 n=1 Tax=Dimorphilus gyrociliatus TaxID=2664684 RepID=A0A7I8W2N8_9ANNE|nr:DgyrCDS9566 [Dimorphilus gyrociliatus]
MADQILIDVPHQEQEWSWDCGLASVKMIFQYYSIPYRKDFNEKKKALSIHTSVWTIDLFRLLRAYNIPCRFATITLGANKDYKSMSFYTEAFRKDECRINSSISNAVEGGLGVEKRHVTLSEIIEHLTKNLPIIALIDSSNLKCLQCHNLDILSSICLAPCMKGYQGHFIVVRGFHKQKEIIYYSNPAKSTDLCCCTFKVFEECRTSFGTDEDLIFIDKEHTSDMCYSLL